MANKIRKRKGTARAPALSKREESLLARWEDAIETIGRALAELERIPKPAPGEEPDAAIKTEVYRLTTELLRTERLSDLESVLARKMEKAPRVSFKENPYYWALKAVWKDGEIEINRNVISKFSAQLLYAARHHIPPELLTGFVNQVGGIRAIRPKLNSGEFEKWYRPDLPWLWTGGADK